VYISTPPKPFPFSFGTGNLILGLFQNLHSFQVPIDKNGTLLTGTRAKCFLGLPYFVARTIGIFIGGAFLLPCTVKNIPTRRQDQEISQASQGKTSFMNKLVDSLDLEHVEISVKSVVCM